MVEIATAVPGVVAARMTGAGFGGCTVNLVRPDAVDALRAAVERDYPARTGLPPRVLPVTRRPPAPAGCADLRRDTSTGPSRRHCTVPGAHPRTSSSPSS